MLLDASDFSEDFRKEYNLWPDRYFILESTSIGKCRDVFRHKVSGVQIVKLRDKIRHYQGAMYHRGIDHGKWGGLSLENIQQLEKTVRKYYGYPYEKSKLALAMSALDFTNFELAEDFTSWFCSEFQGYNLVTFGYLKAKLNELTPSDFGGDAIKLLKGRKWLEVRKIAEVLL